MVFSGSLFLFLFLPLFMLLYFGIPNPLIKPTIPWRNGVLFVGSVFFYAWGEPLYIILILLSILANYAMAIQIDAGKADVQNSHRYMDGKEKPGMKKKSNCTAKKWLIAAVAFNLIVLGIFKYASFFASNITALFGLPAPEWHIPLPIGISFYTFHILSYLIDIYWGNVKVQRNPFYLGAYIVAFPQLVAGPVVRYKTIEHELHHRRENLDDFASGIRRFIIGLGKKVLIANNVAFVADTILARTPAEYGMIGAWTAIICYTLQIYFDFSGYSDMAIGLGRMLGFHYLENFNYPYIAKSVADFWRRWHISLSSFFRDYVYIPLGGNRVKQGRFVLNILIVWSLTGLWHGSSWNFVIWGTYYGVFLLAEKLWIGKILNKTPAPVQHIYTMLIVMIGWAIFRMESGEGVLELLGAMFGAYGMSSLDFLSAVSVLQAKYILAALVGIVASAPVVPAMVRCFGGKKGGRTGIVLLSDCLLMILLFMSVISLLGGGFNPFIYFRF